MKLSNDFLLDYNEKVRDIIIGLCEIYDKECSHIFLYGSGALNKLSIKEADGQMYFYSDIEFIVIPKDKENENNKQFKKKMMDKSFDYVKSKASIRKAPFIDVNPVSREFFEKAQKRISIFELKNNAVCIKGDNLLHLLPDISTENYDFRIQNIEVVKGLKILLMESYKYFFCFDNTSQNNEDEFSYFLSSSYLNILRTLLPMFDIFALTIEDRVSEIQTIKKNPRIIHFFSNQMLDEFERVAKSKEKCNFAMKNKDFFVLVYDTYKSLLCLILDCDKYNLMEAISDRRNEIFFGDEIKVEMLSRLTIFFISTLNCIEELVISNHIDGISLKNAKNRYDDLVYGKNTFEFMQIMENYTKMEKSRWKIIGSKD